MRRNNERGFSLAETVIASAIFMAVTAGSLTLISITHRRYSNEKSAADVQWQGRSAMDLMVRELRMAGYPAKNTYVGTANLTSANSNLVASTFAVALPQQVVFEADTNGDGVVERIEYVLSGTTLMRSAVAKNADGSVPVAQYEPMIENVGNGTAALFTYNVDPYSTLPPPGNTNSVQVVLQLHTAAGDPKNGQKRTLTFEGYAYRHNADR